MALSLIEVYEFLRDNRYLLSSKGAYNLSKSFADDIKKLQKPVLGVSVLSSKDITLSFRDQQMKFINFIMVCQVPLRIQMPNGQWYDCNKFNEEACKRFVEIISKDDINHELLIASTTLYYKSGNGFKKKISNYILDGDWMTDYMTLQAKAEEGGTAVKDHIKEEIKANEQFDPFS